MASTISSATQNANLSSEPSEPDKPQVAPGQAEAQDEEQAPEEQDPEEQTTEEVSEEETPEEEAPEGEPAASVFDVARGIASTRGRLVSQVRVLQDLVATLRAEVRVTRTKLEASEDRIAELQQQLDEAATDRDEAQRALTETIERGPSEEAQALVLDELASLGVEPAELPRTAIEEEKTATELWAEYESLPIEERAEFYRTHREKLRP